MGRIVNIMKKNKIYSTFSIILLISSLFAVALSATTFVASQATYDYYVSISGGTISLKNSAGTTLRTSTSATALFASIPQGTSWYIGPGRYVGIIVINQSSTSITGAGIDSTIIECPIGVYRNVIQAGNEDGYLTSSIYIGYLTVNGRWDKNPPVEPCAYPNELQQNGVSLQYVRGATIDHVKATNTPWNGLQAIQSHYVNYKYCIVDGCHWHGLQFWSDTLYSTMQHCSVNNCSGGITSEFGSNDNSITDVVVTNIGNKNDMTWGGSSAILIGYNVHNIYIANAQIDNAPFGVTFYGYGTGTSYNLTLNGAQITNCLEGIYLNYINDGFYLSKAFVSDCNWNNVYTMSASNGVVNNCTFVNSGVYLDSDSNYWNFTNCVFQNCPVTDLGVGTKYYTVVEPTPTPSSTPIATPTPTPSSTATPTPTPTFTTTPTVTPTPTPIQINVELQPFNITLQLDLTTGAWTAPNTLSMWGKTWTFSRWSDGYNEAARIFTVNGNFVAIYT